MIDAAAWRDRWSALAPRERRIVVTGILIVAAALAVTLLWLPLVADLPRARAEADRAERRLASATAAVATAASRATTPSRAPLEAALRAALARHGIGSGEATLEVAGARATLTLPSLRFATLVALVDALAREDAVTVVEATITARVEPGRVRAELALSR
ncbi:MAG TPA: type II secretion system protein GspM [Casimicrobiaceae bacterium]|nr:type II secretion system protein GspM [Casimicrobiaceae bacterium]